MQTSWSTIDDEADDGLLRRHDDGPLRPTRWIGISLQRVEAKHDSLSRTGGFACEHARNVCVVSLQESRRIGVVYGCGPDPAAASADTQLGGCAWVQTLDPRRAWPS
jgi:hypothetical protein